MQRNILKFSWSAEHLLLALWACTVHDLAKCLVSSYEFNIYTYYEYMSVSDTVGS